MCHIVKRFTQLTRHDTVVPTQYVHNAMDFSLRISETDFSNTQPSHMIYIFFLVNIQSFIQCSIENIYRQ